MIAIPYQVAAAKGLRGEDRELVLRLVRAWERHRSKNVLRHEYYLMHNTLRDLGISVPPELTRLNAACGWAKKCVDVMVEHSKLDGFTVADEEAQSALDALWARCHLRTKYRRAATSALEECFALWFVSRDEDGLARVSAYPADACGVTWDDARDQIEAAAFVVSMGRNESLRTWEPTWVNVATDRWLIRVRKAESGEWGAEYEPHGLGRVPCFPMAYEPTLHRPLGTSRITREIMGYIDSAVRANVNEEISSAFAASAQKYLLGTDGDPFEEVTKWDAFIGNIFNIDANTDGTVPTFGQLPQPSMQPLADHWRLLCGRMSAATGIHVSQFGIVHDQPASGEAIYAENEPLILKVRDWNEAAADVLADVATACLATERNTTFAEVRDEALGIEARFRNPAMPTLAQQTDSAIKIAGVLEGFAQTDTFLELNGFGKEERTRIAREIRRARGDAMILGLDLMGGGEPLADRQEGPAGVPRAAGPALPRSGQPDRGAGAEVAS